MNTEKRTKTKRGILVALLLVCFLAIIAGTYARYSTSATLNAKTSVAKWAVKLGEDDISKTTKTIDLTLTRVENNYVAENKFAPNVTYKGTIDLDLTGTEVAVDLSATVDKTGLSGFASSDKMVATVKLGDTEMTGTQTINLSDIGKKTVNIELTWENDEQNNADDSASGFTSGDITVPVVLTVQQHIASAS